MPKGASPVFRVEDELAVSGEGVGDGEGEGEEEGPGDAEGDDDGEGEDDGEGDGDGDPFMAWELIDCTAAMLPGCEIICAPR